MNKNLFENFNIPEGIFPKPEELITIKPNPTPGLLREQNAIFKHHLTSLTDSVAELKAALAASSASQRRIAIFANTMAAIAAIMATIAAIVAIPIIIGWLK